MIQTWENGENVILGPILTCLAQISAPNVFLGFTSTRC